MRLASVWLNTIPGTNPPPSIRTFFQVYASLGAALAGPSAIWEVITASAPARSAAATAGAKLLRIAPEERDDRSIVVFLSITGQGSSPARVVGRRKAPEQMLLRAPHGCQ